VFCRSVLKVSKVLRTSSVIVRVKFVSLFPYLLATTTSINLTNSSGVRLEVTVGVAVAIVVMAGTVFLVTLVCVSWKHTSFLFEFLLERPPLYLGQILHRHPDCVVRPNLGPSSTILGFRILIPPRMIQFWFC
jgi:hypothetical protein